MTPEDDQAYTAHFCPQCLKDLGQAMAGKVVRYAGLDDFTGVPGITFEDGTRKQLKVAISTDNEVHLGLI